jgi:Dolichyl-phosphate-mannose-protein mannosyltransferase
VPNPSRRELTNRALFWIAAGAVVLGGLLRVGAARGDLWLDEIWSLNLARVAPSALDVIWGLHFDNNDYLNTLWMRLWGDDGSALVQRALSVVTGVGLVALGAALPLERGRLAAALTALLLAGSRFLVHYGSEARGYGPALFFALAAYLAAERYFETRERRWAAVFAASGALGLLSHLTFVFVLAGVGAWVAADWLRSRRASPVDLALLALPVALLGFLWVVDIRLLAVGGAPHYDPTAVLPDLAGATLGLPEGGLRWLGLGFAAVAGYELYERARARDLRAVFFAAALLAPVPYLLLLRPEYVYPRHFAVLVPLFLYLVGSGLARIARLGRVGLAGALVALGVFAAGNAVQLAALLRDGRGHYREAVELILANSPPGPITIGSLHDFRNRTVLEDQARRLGVRDRIVYVEAARIGEQPPRWLVMHDFREEPPRMDLIEVFGHPYGLVRIFPYGGISGWTWLVYHEVPQPPR